MAAEPADQAGPVPTTRDDPRRPGGRLRRWVGGLRRRAGPTGLVLSGGGSGAGFQLGALRYLYDVAGVTPTVFTGTSAGSILAALLAQSETHDGQRAVLADIERIARGFRRTADMLTELPWYTELLKLAPSWQRAQAIRPSAAPVRSSAAPPGPPRAPRRRARVRRSAAVDGSRAEGSSVLDRLSVIWTMSRSGTNFDALLNGARRERSMFEPGPVFDQLLDPAVFDPRRLAASGTVLRIAVVSLESGDLRYVTGSGALVDRHDRPLAMEIVPVVDAIRASCAIPAIFPPVRLGAEHYVDGGTRASIPVEIATARLGVGRCYVVVALAGAPVPETSFAARNMLSIVLRSTTGILTAELRLNEITSARAAGAVVIAPQLDVLDALVVDPGLLAIATDYGYLRAAEACQAATVEEQAVTRRLIEHRRLVWTSETELFGPRALRADGTVRLAALVELKLQLRDLTLQVPAERLPAGAPEWWRRWEDHDFPVTAPVSWT